MVAGVVDFILNMDFEGEGMSKSYGYICKLMGEPEMIKAPRFKDYNELEEILEKGFGIYKDIKAELEKSGINFMMNSH